VQHRAPEVTIESEGKPAPHVINIMDALKKSMQKQGQAKVSDAVRKRMGKAATPKARGGRSTEPRTGSRRTAH
jgi:non-homologous end joining protein Ku